MNRRPIAPLAAVVVILGVNGCGTDDASDMPGRRDAHAATVTVRTFEFEPDPITIEAGDTVTFINHDAIDHTVTAGSRDDPKPGAFDGRLPQKGARFELTLTDPGTYEYFCTIHPGPGMTGVIEVR